MIHRSYSDEAKYCRRLATHLVEDLEKPFLLKVADAFDVLAQQDLHAIDIGIDPLGELLTLENLPAVNTVRWTPRRKAEVVAAVAGRLLSAGEACKRYSLTAEELEDWQRRIDHGGLRGLRATRIQDHRPSCDRRYSFESDGKG